MIELRLLKVKSLEEGRELLIKNLEELGLKRTRRLSLEESLGLILAQDLVAKEDIPFFNRSSVDGFALKSINTTGASDSLPTMLKIVEDIPMGGVPSRALASGEASRLMTGGMLPEGADAMVMIEDTEIMGQDLLAVYKPARAYDHVVEIGEDCRKGDILFRRGSRIGPRLIAAAASLGYAELEVFKPLKVRIISTGDELISPGEELRAGKTRDVNSYALEALARELGLEVLGKTHVKDDRDSIERALSQEADLIFISGSSSQGDKDYLAGIISSMRPGLIFHGLAIKPGKPTILGSDGKKLFLGFPGHPVSSYFVFKAFFEEAIRQLYGMEARAYKGARLAHNMAASPGRSLYQACELVESQGELLARPIFGASGSLSVLARAQGYFVIEDKEEGVGAGDLVQVYPLD